MLPPIWIPACQISTSTNICPHPSPCYIAYIPHAESDAVITNPIYSDKIVTSSIPAYEGTDLGDLGRPVRRFPVIGILTKRYVLRYNLVDDWLVGERTFSTQGKD